MQRCARGLTVRDRYQDRALDSDAKTLHCETEVKTETSTGLETKPETLGEIWQNHMQTSF